ncbi:glutaredoxin domain-containing protein [Paraliobacillus ryukyuensis]|uniref:glutaredoxin domain-containing protein n=1 Tax=Paraliobacillus ryukyuensis TaxID=200904 RepID=UPI0015C422DC|nr:glutaredoxin domain-containing protein [Paraliobacillus ryukyuensis]
MSKITVYTKYNCPKCEVTKTMLDGEGAEYESVNVEDDADALEYIKSLGFTSTPVITKQGYEPFSGFNLDKLKEMINLRC